MVAPQKRQGGSPTTPPFSFASFVVGICLGCYFMFLYMNEEDRPLLTTLPGPGTPRSDNNKNNKNKMRILSDGTKEQEDEVDNGWHAIHVFYGEKAGLGADPQQVSYAQSHQDEIILDLLGTSGFFIDLAANDALIFSNTLALERHDGWHGLCIEPNPAYWYGLAHRKCTVVGALMGGKVVQQVNAKFRGVYGGIVGKIDRKLANRKNEPTAPTERRYTVPLTQVLENYKVPKVIDYMSLDIEGAEFLVMQHFPFDSYQIKVLTVERPDQQLHELFAKYGYIHLKDLTWWGETLWAHQSTGFTPEHPKIKKIVFEGK